MGLKDANLVPGERCLASVRLVAFDFDGVFTDNMVYVLEDGSEAVRCFRGDGLGLRKLERLGIATVIISSETNPVVATRSAKLKIRCVQGVADKRRALEEIMLETGLKPEQVAYVGNDVNDSACLAYVGFPIIVQDAHDDVAALARYRTRLPGGHGAVREICDWFEQALRPADGNDALEGLQ